MAEGAKGIDPQMTQTTQNAVVEERLEPGEVPDPTIRDPETYAIIGAALEVHKQLGCGFLEKAYQEALAIEFAQRGIPFRSEMDLPILYKGKLLNTVYRADFACYENVLVELKAIKEAGGVERAQVIHYLKAGGFRVGLLLNFGGEWLEYKRFAGNASILLSVSSVSSVDEH